MEPITILDKISAAFFAQSGLEFVAVICAVVYLILVVKESIWCWVFAFVSTALFIYIFHNVSLFSESVLNVYYLIMAVYGWWNWTNKKHQKELKIHCWSLKSHAIVVFITCLLTPIVGTYMKSLGASFAYLDAFVAILSIIATVMLAQKVFENWYYWLLIDSLSIYLFWHKQLYFVAALYVAYIVLIFVGIKSWKNTMKVNNQLTN